MLLNFEHPHNMIIKVKVSPKTKTEAIKYDPEQNLYRVRVTEPAQDGKANSAVIKLLAKQFNVAISNVIIKSGFTNRNKTILIKSDKA